MRWRILHSDEYAEDQMAQLQADGTLWCHSPSEVPIAVPAGFGVMQALIQLHIGGLESVVRQALQTA